VSESESAATQSAQSIDVTEKDLPLHCPMARTPLWSYHPRVFLQFSIHAGDGAPRVKCPYCGTDYVFKGAALPGH
jgi:uncharacterized Zn-finger protein